MTVASDGYVVQAQETSEAHRCVACASFARWCLAACLTPHLIRCSSPRPSVCLGLGRSSSSPRLKIYTGILSLPVHVTMLCMICEFPIQLGMRTEITRHTCRSRRWRRVARCSTPIQRSIGVQYQAAVQRHLYASTVRAYFTTQCGSSTPRRPVRSQEPMETHTATSRSQPPGTYRR